MDNIEIVTLQPDQWQEYKKLRLEALKGEPQAYGSSYKDNLKLPDETWKQLLEDSLKGESQWYLFAKHRNNLVGMVGAFVKENNIAQVIAVYVTKEMRGQGIAKQLMDDLISKIAQNKSIKKLSVGVNPIQSAALNLYQSLGFTIVKKEKTVLGDGKEYEVYELEKDIN